MSRIRGKHNVVQPVVVTLLCFLSFDCVSAQSGWIYWTDSNTNTIHRARLENPVVGDPLVSELDRVRRIAVDVLGHKMYWTGSMRASFHSANLNGKNVELHGQYGVLQRPHGIALDLKAKHVYWTDHDAGTLSRAKQDGSRFPDGRRFELLQNSLSNPHQLALDVQNRQMYWLEQGPGRIMRSDLDGGPRARVLSTPGPHGIALDLRNRRMYWTSHTDGTPHVVCRANLDGTEEHCWDSGRNAGPIALDINGFASDGDPMVYWGTPDGVIWRSGLKGQGTEAFLRGVGTAAGIAFDFSTADFDQDGDVDGDDFLLWQRGFGIGQDARLLDGDADRDEDVDGDDFLFWQREVGSRFSATTSQTSAVPEPSCGIIATLLSAYLCLTARSHRLRNRP